jgi:hypothetical protein
LHRLYAYDRLLQHHIAVDDRSHACTLVTALDHSPKVTIFFA